MRKGSFGCVSILLTALVVIMSAVFFTPAERAHAEGPTVVYSPSTGVTGELGYFLVDDIYYYIAKKPGGGNPGQVYVAGCKDAATEIKIQLTVSRSGTKYTVLGINDKAFEGKKIKKVEIAAGIGLISDSAFSKCASLESISIGEGVTEIRSYAFFECSALKTVKLPSSVTMIGKASFSYCKGLTQINCPEAVKEIPESAFAGCESLKSFSFGKNVKVIGEYAFRGCSSLKSVTFDKALTTIQANAFRECSGLKGLKFSANIKNVGRAAFFGCSSLETVKINKKVTTIPESCFEGCSSLKSATISNNTKTIEKNAFGNCSSLEKVKGKNKKLKTIGDSAFGGTSALRSFSFGKVKTIGAGAFSGSGLRELKLPKTVTSLGGGAFSGSHIRTLTVPGSVKEIPKSAFSDCKWLEKAVLMDGVEIIGDEAFRDDSSMDIFEYPESVHYVGRNAFERTAWLAYAQGQFLTKHELSEGFDKTEQYYWNYFSYYDSSNVLDYSHVPDAVCINDVCIWVCVDDHEYNPQGFWTVKGKETVEFPSGIKMINAALDHDEQLKKIIIPEGVEILDGMFTLGNNKYRDPIEVVLPSTLREFNCSMSGPQFTGIVMPKNLESIGDMAFSSQYENFLQSVKFTGNKLKSIGERSFANTENLTSIELPEGLKSIGNGAFANSGLKKIKLPESIREIGTGAFDGTQITKIVLPDKYEISSEITTDHENVVFEVRKNTKAHKAFLKFAESYSKKYWRLKVKE